MLPTYPNFSSINFCLWCYIYKATFLSTDFYKYLYFMSLYAFVLLSLTHNGYFRADVPECCVVLSRPTITSMWTFFCRSPFSWDRQNFKETAKEMFLCPQYLLSKPCSTEQGKELERDAQSHNSGWGVWSQQSGHFHRPNFQSLTDSATLLKVFLNLSWMLAYTCSPLPSLLPSLSLRHTHLYCSVVRVQQELSQCHNLGSTIPAIWAVH